MNTGGAWYSLDKEPRRFMQPWLSAVERPMIDAEGGEDVDRGPVGNRGSFLGIKGFRERI